MRVVYECGCSDEGEHPADRCPLHGHEWKLAYDLDDEEDDG